MKKILLIVLWLMVAHGYAQVRLHRTDTLAHQKRLTVANVNRDQSYLAFGSGFGNLEPLVFEAKFSQGFLITARNRSWALMFNPQIQVRMLNRRSVPIRSPSYRGHFTFYRAIGREWPTLLYEDVLWFVAVGHHSNGQDGDFYQDDSTQLINLDEGNFSTNFVRLGATFYSLRPAKNSVFSIMCRLVLLPTLPNRERQ